MGEKRAILVCGIEAFLQDFQTPTAFDDVAACLVDLELRGGSTPALADKAGLELVLPHVRRTAPWVPVACISRYISGSDEVIAELSASDFDSFFPKSIVGEFGRVHSEFNLKRWRSILLGMQMRRIACTTGQSVDAMRTAVAAAPFLQFDRETVAAAAALGISERELGSAISTLGLGGAEFSVSALDLGFSGVNVSKLRVGGNDNGEPIWAAWLLKWGKPVSKLGAEAFAHRQAVRRGISRELIVPQFNQGAIVFGSCGFLVYAFEKEAQSALSVVKEGGLPSLVEPIRNLSLGLYANGRSRSVDLGVQVAKWIGDDLVSVADRGQLVESTWALLHGDLHLRNIFVRGPRSTLIDFARSDFGPISVDVAKLFIDLLCFGPEGVFDGLASLSLVSFRRSSFSPLLEPFEAQMKEPGDAVTFDVFAKGFAKRYMSYGDVPKMRKTRIAALLECN